MIEGSIHLFADRISLARQAVHDQWNFASQRFNERRDCCAQLLAGRFQHSRRAKHKTGWLRHPPTLAILQSPGMNYDNRRLRQRQIVRNLDVAAGGVRIPPGADLEIGVRVIHQRRTLEAASVVDRQYKIGIVREQRFRIFDWLQTVFVNALLNRCARRRRLAFFFRLRRGASKHRASRCRASPQNAEEKTPDMLCVDRHRAGSLGVTSCGSGLAHSLHYCAMRRSSDWAAFQNYPRNASFRPATKRAWPDTTEVPHHSW